MSKDIPNRQQLLDDYAERKADLQHARRIGNKHEMALCVTEMDNIQTTLMCNNNITRVELTQ